MEIENITAALRGNPTAGECDDLVRACDPLRVKRRNRLLDITPLPGLPFDDQPAGYRQAILTDANAPGEERQRLLRELAQIDALESAIGSARETALDAEARTAIPKARKQLPALVRQLRESLAALKAAAGELNTAMLVLANYERIPGKQIPIDDDQLAAILEIRNELWQPLLVNSLTLPDDPESPVAKKFPKSWELSYERRGSPIQPTIVARVPPKHFNPWEYSDVPVYRIPHARKTAA